MFISRLCSDECCNCKHFSDEGEYYLEYEDDWFDDVICELGHYDHVGYHANACCDFERGE